MIGYKGAGPWRTGHPPSAWFRRYRDYFTTVELPSTRMRVPSKAQVLAWKKRAGEGFVYSFQSPRYLTFTPSGAERRSLRRFLKRHRLLGSARGGVRFRLPDDLDPQAFQAWLAMLRELDLPGDYAFEGPQALEVLALKAGYAAVGLGEGPFFYLIDPDPKALPEGKGYAYFSTWERAEKALRHVRASGSSA